MRRASRDLVVQRSPRPQRPGASSCSGFVAMKKNPEAKPWPMITAIAGSIIFIICLVIGIIMAVNWIPWLIEYGNM